MADSLRQQTESFTAAMGAQTEQLARLSDKVESMNSRVIRLEEARHGRDIQKLSDEVNTLSTRLTALEILRAKGEGISAFMNWLRMFAPWFGVIAIAGLVALGFERKP